jgi:ACDE family multidrug resistance protein
VLIPAVIASGIFIGINNTITTQAVMTIAPVERPVASAAYSFVRFIGGGLAPYAAGRLVQSVNIHFPFYLAAGAVAAGILILTTVHNSLHAAERTQATEVRAAAGPATEAPSRIAIGPDGQPVRPAARRPQPAKPRATRRPA